MIIPLTAIEWVYEAETTPIWVNTANIIHFQEINEQIYDLFISRLKPEIEKQEAMKQLREAEDIANTLSKHGQSALKKPIAEFRYPKRELCLGGTRLMYTGVDGKPVFMYVVESPYDIAKMIESCE